MILLTGASGYLGRCVLAKLHERSLPCFPVSRSGVVGWSCDLTHEDAVRQLFERVKPTAVIHCAANVPKEPFEFSDVCGAGASALMAIYIAHHFANCAREGTMVYASSQVVERPTTAYACAKIQGEVAMQGREARTMRLPGLFGLPRRSGVIYESAVKGEILDSYGPYPAMHVQDAAEYLVRAATLPSDGHPDPYTVTYGNERLERVYGSLGVTFRQRVQELVEQVKA